MTTAMFLDGPKRGEVLEFKGDRIQVPVPVDWYAMWDLTNEDETPFPIDTYTVQRFGFCGRIYSFLSKYHDFASDGALLLLIDSDPDKNRAIEGNVNGVSK